MTIAPVPFESLEFEPILGPLAVVRLRHDAPIPAWAGGVQSFVSITRSDQELSIVAPDSAVPDDDAAILAVERSWAGWRVKGTLEFAMVGILAAITQRLADAGVSVFALSTYDTDYLLVKEQDRHDAATALGIS